MGSAGKLFDRALAEAGIDRERAYVTNVVKHFKWRPAGQRRLHQKPNAEEIGSCRPWLEAEIDCVQPRVVVCLGATDSLPLWRICEWRPAFTTRSSGDNSRRPQSH